MGADAERRELLDIVSRFAVGLVLLIALLFIVPTLPMVRDLGFLVPPSRSGPYRAGLTWALIFDIALRTWIILLLSFGSRLRAMLLQVGNEIAWLGTSAFLSAVFAAAFIGYFAYDDVIVPPLGQQAWVYRLAFAMLAIGSLAGLGVNALSEFRPTLGAHKNIKNIANHTRNTACARQSGYRNDSQS